MVGGRRVVCARGGCPRIRSGDSRHLRLELVKGSTKAIRHTGSVIYQVASGHGWSEIGDQRFEWEEKDIFCIPSWTPYRHGAQEEAVLFSFNDFPAMKALALFREEHC